jgi:Ca-activated chloride channel family protein
VLVLDHSGSMQEPASDSEKTPKIEALHLAAARFVEIMRTGAKTTLLPFSDRAETPKPFSNDKAQLKADIQQLQAQGNTALYDATYDGIETLQAARPEGKRAVVVLTDGMDEPGSRHRVEEVIQRARETKTPLYMLGFGRPGEINIPVMERMARETNGRFYHARNQEDLMKIFEHLSMELHDDGIDEPTLTRLAKETGGRYFPVRDISQLELIYSELASEFQNTYTVTFPSRRSSHDGTARGIDISIVRDGVRVSAVARADYNVRGVVVPEMDHRVYLLLLLALTGLLVVPSGIRRLYKLYGGT